MLTVETLTYTTYRSSPAIDTGLPVEAIMTSIVDPAFEKIVNNKVKFIVFRVNNLKLVPVPENDVGKFYSGDCYLLWDARHGADNIYFWIGSESSQDERAVVAIKAVELDNLFGGQPTQHREVQGHESLGFRRMFPGGLVTLQGGHTTGLRKVSREKEGAKLLQVMGGKYPVMREVSLAWANMNHGDTFVLDTGSIIFIWSGSSSSPGEKMTAASLANRLRDKLGEEIVHVADGDEEDLECEELKAWNAYLPLDAKSEVKEACKDSDRKASNIVMSAISLHKCSDLSGELTVTLAKKGNIEKEDLKEDDSFIVEAGHLGVWIWLGRRSNENERKGAMNAGLKFIEKNKLDENVSVTKVSMGTEPEDFKSLFVNWS